MSRPCKYGCGTQLEGFDEENRKYLEAATGGLHTKERCQEAKTKLQSKNDHGNEVAFVGTTMTDTNTVHSKVPLAPQFNTKVLDDIPFVDHTLKPRLKAKTFTDPTPEGLDLQINTFGDTYNIRHGQYRTAGSLYSTQVWYEEVAK